MRIGEQIKNYRKTAGLTQEQVANYLGVSTCILRLNSAFFSEIQST